MWRLGVFLSGAGGGGTSIWKARGARWNFELNPKRYQDPVLLTWHEMFFTLKRYQDAVLLAWLEMFFTPKRYQDPVLWVWLEMFFTPKKYQFWNKTLSLVIIFSPQYAKKYNEYPRPSYVGVPSPDSFPLGEMLVHRSCPSPPPRVLLGIPDNFSSTHVHTWMARREALWE